MSAEKPTPERIVVDFPKTEIADEKTRRVITEATRLVGNFFRSKLERAEFWLEFAHSSLPGLGNGFGNGHFGIIAFSSTSGSMRRARRRARTSSTVA